MTSTSRFQSPRVQKRNSILSLQSSVINDSKQKQKHKSQIQNLVRKFNEANDQIQVDKANFNLVQYERENDKIKYDPQMMTAKLRKLQNRAQINRAQMQIQNREKKFYNSIKKRKSPEKGQRYQQIYNKYIKDRKISSQLDDSDEDQSTRNENGPKGVSHYNSLKKHPKLLQYTLQRINEKSQEVVDQGNKLKQMKNHIKQNMNVIAPEYKQILDEVSKQNKTTTANPQSIIEGPFAKIFLRKSTQSIKQDIREIPRCNKIIEKQNQILIDIDEKSLSKDGKKQLKSKLNEIVVGISKSEKTREFQLPKISSRKQKR